MRMNWSFCACSGHCFIRYKRHEGIQSVFGVLAELQKGDHYLHHACLSVCLSAQNPAFTGRIFTKFDI